MTLRNFEIRAVIDPCDPQTPIGQAAYSFCKVGHILELKVSQPKWGAKVEWYKDRPINPLIEGQRVHTGLSYTFTPTEEKEYTFYAVSTYDAEGGTSDIRSLPLEVKVSFNPVPPVSVSKVKYKLVASPADIEKYRYKWWFENNEADVIATDVDAAFCDAGTYHVRMFAKNGPDDCYTEASIVIGEDALAAPETPAVPQGTQIPEVISASAATFSDNWSTGVTDANLTERSAYFNGQKGVWRSSSTFAYNRERDYEFTKDGTGDVNVEKDGTFTLESFNWNTTDDNPVSNWLRANTITRYSPEGYELENRDVLGRHSSAIYGYNGQLPVAVAANARYGETAFSSFETSDDAGNFLIHVEVSKRTATYQVVLGDDNLAYVAAPVENLVGVEEVQVLVNYIEDLPSMFILRRKVKIACKKSDPSDPRNTIVLFDDGFMEAINRWSGAIYFVVDLSHGADPGIVSGEKAHTGKKSIKITETENFSQGYLDLVPGKKYVLSGWTSVSGYDPTQANMDGVSIGIGFGEGGAATTATTVGNIIEGWQKIEAEFVAGEGTMNLSFTPPPGKVVYFDDLRLFPSDGNMQTYVYDTYSNRLSATLDNNNYATLYYYDAEGSLKVLKKETVRGIVTVQEAASHQKGE